MVLGVELRAFMGDVSCTITRTFSFFNSSGIAVVLLVLRDV